MSKYNVSRRIQFIIQYINDEKYASKQEILNYLADKDFKVSPRTLERDFENIKSDFGIELAYDKGRNAYYIDEEKSVKVSSFFKFLELVTLADVFTDGLKDSHKIFDYVSFDDSRTFKGIDNLEPIIIAIKQGRKLQFTHYNYSTKFYTNYIVTPLIIKEYLNRWYLIGVPDDLDDIRTFGIDRLENIGLGRLSKLKKNRFKVQLDKFNDIIGLYITDKEPDRIVLKVDGEHLKYLESLPLHHSQEITWTSDQEYGYASYHLIPNYEFTTQLLKMSMELEVIEPEHYRKFFKNEVKKIYNKYYD